MSVDASSPYLDVTLRAYYAGNFGPEPGKPEAPVKRALVLSGGGAKGAWEAGVITELARHGRQWDIFAGSSVGALNAAYMAQYAHALDGANMLEVLWSSLKTSDVYEHHNRFLRWLLVPFKNSVYSTRPLLKTIKKNYNPANIINGKTVLTTSVDLTTGTSCVHQNGSAEDILASCAVPLLFSPVARKPQFLVDGGIRDMTPLGSAIKAGATDIDVVVCHPPVMGRWEAPSGLGSLLQIAARTLEVVMSEVIENDLETCKRINMEVSVRGPGTRVFGRSLTPKPRRYVKLNIFRQSARTPVIDSFVFDPGTLQYAIACGRNDGYQQLAP